jgi:hypothetical protein
MRRLDVIGKRHLWMQSQGEEFGKRARNQSVFLLVLVV